MQPTTLPIQANGGASPNAPQRSGGSGDAGQEFSAALSREMAQRRPSGSSPQAPQPSKPQAASKPQADDKPALADPKASAQADAPAPEEDLGKPAEAAASSGADAAAEVEPSQDAAAAAAQANPVVDMLALVASFNQHVQGIAARPVEARASDAVSGIAAKLRGETGQLAALQGAFKRLGQDAGEADQTNARANPAGPLRPALPDGFDAVPSSGTHKGLDLRGAEQPADDEAHAHLPEAEFGAQPAREAATQSADALKSTIHAAQLVAQAHPAVMEAAQAVAAPRDHLPAQVGTPDWDNQVGQKIVWMVAGGDQSASLTLNPPDLGPMQVVLNVSGDQASVAFSSNQHEVRQALENALPRLREMMGESGISLGSATVSAGMPDQRQAQGEQGGNGSRHGAHIENGAASAETAPRTARTQVLGDRGMVDTFA